MEPVNRPEPPSRSIAVPQRDARRYTRPMMEVRADGGYVDSQQLNRVAFVELVVATDQDPTQPAGAE